jgi:diketogulonate reductase-like aldo/keto reductase
MGFNETLAQVAATLSMGPPGWLGAIDLLLLHWPSCASGGGCNATPASTDPPCMWGTPSYDERVCRLSTYRAMTQTWMSGGARAIGVSNFNSTQLQEIITAGLPVPAVNQIPFFLYHSVEQVRGAEGWRPASGRRVSCGIGLVVVEDGRCDERWSALSHPTHATAHSALPSPLTPTPQADTIAWCAKHGVVVNSYSPFGVPDRRVYPAPASRTPLQDPVAAQVAAAHNVSSAAVQLAWASAQGMVVNPR